MPSRFRFIVLVACALFVTGLTPLAPARHAAAAEKLGGIAQIDVPTDFQFFDGPQTIRIMTKLGNPPSNRELGMLTPKDEKSDWLMVFEYDDCGYVKDDEGAKLDASAILESIKQGNEHANEYRRNNKQAPLNIVGWHTPPTYNPQTHNLEWCVTAESEGHQVLNYNIRILGRAGVMEVTLVCGPEQLATVLPQSRKLLEGYSYVSGQNYSEWKSGDKIAEYGLAALVAGGAAAVVLKSGLLTKLIKPIIIGVAVVGGFIAKTFKRITGRGESTT